MKESKHEILKAEWKKMIYAQSQSGLSIRQWCRDNNYSHGRFYYWQRIIREEALINAGTLAVTGQSQFVEVNPSIPDIKSTFQEVCVVLHSNGNKIEILNGADPDTLGTVFNLINKL